MNFSKNVNLKFAKNNKVKWFLIIASLIFVVLRIPSLVEPHWYGDEGIYQVVGRAILNGEILYKNIWDNKPPLLYIIYAIFNGNLFYVKFLSLIFGLLSLFSFYFLTGEILKKTSSRFLSVFVYMILFAIPLIEGNISNAENFMLLPITLAAYLVLKYKDKGKIFYLSIAGFLLSFAFLIKVVAVFDFLAFFTFLGIILWEEHGRKTLRYKYLKSHVIFGLIFTSLMVLSALYFASVGALKDFLNAVFSQNISYVNVENNFIIPNGILVLKTLILFCVIFFIFKKRKSLKTHELFVYIWLSFSIYNALFSQRPYIHYALVLLPVFSILFGMIVESKNKRVINALLLIGIYLLSYFYLTMYKKTIEYYVNYSQFISNKKSVVDYQNFFDRQTPHDYEIANFISSNLKKDEQVFLWSDSAQIYILSNKLPIEKYIVAYHITFYKDAEIETRNAIEKKKPRFIIQTSWAPFPAGILANYRLRYIVSEAKIYEREF